MDALIYGALIKVYEDLDDNKILQEGWIKRSLEYVIVVLQYLLLVSDFNFAIVYYAMNVACAFFHPETYSSPYELSLIFLSPIPLILSYGTYKPFTAFSLLYALSGILTFIIEPYAFPEEASIMKIVSRMLMLSTAIVILKMGIREPWVTKLTYVTIGYMSASNFFQILKLHEAVPIRSTSTVGTVGSLLLV